MGVPAGGPVLYISSRPNLLPQGMGMLKFNWSSSDLSIGTHGVHYAWVIVAVVSTMRLVSSAIRQASSVLVPYLADPRHFGWSYGSIGFGFTLVWISSGIFGPPAGWLGDRYGVRRTMVLGSVLFMGGMVLTGTMTHLWQFYLYFGIIMSASMAIFHGAPGDGRYQLVQEAPWGGYGTPGSIPGIGTGS